MYILKNNMRRAQKLAQIASRPAFWPALRRRIYPAIEHVSLFEAVQFDTIIDVGANVGQFAIVAHALNRDAIIHSFEPIGACHARIVDLARDYPRIRPRKAALGAQDGEATINLASSLGSSSLLPFDPKSQDVYPNITSGGKETILVRTLDGELSAEDLRGRTLLKLDVQGFELEALKGGPATLARVDMVYLEASFVSLYAGQPLADEVIDFMNASGFALRGIDNVDYGARSLPVQADFLFERSRAT
jgi:FkbM family methyltransferase